MSYTSGSHTVFHHRYHIVWITKYRYKVLEGALRERIRTIIRQVRKDLGVQIVSGILSREHVHMLVEIPPHVAVSDFVRRVVPDPRRLMSINSPGFLAAALT
jgi:putative transposase